MERRTISCHRCHRSWTYEPPLARGDECPGCRSDTKVCRNCQFFDTSAHHECRESQAEWVRDKERANFCGYFEPLAAAPKGPDATDTAKADLASLFGDDEAPTSRGPASLDDLFKK